MNSFFRKIRLPGLTTRLISMLIIILVIVSITSVIYSQMDPSTTNKPAIITVMQSQLPVSQATSPCWNNNCSRSSTRSLARCHFSCGPTKVIWPQPTGDTSIGSQFASFRLQDVKYDVSAISEYTRPLLKKALDVFKSNVRDLEDQLSSSNMDLVNVKVIFRKFEDEYTEYLTLETDESYKLTVEKEKDLVIVMISAGSFFGARHALETLSQLMWWEADDGAYQLVHNVNIVDEPNFPYRGIMVDTARNFMPITALRRTIDGMAASKLNVLHLHLTDSHSFSFESRRYPQMSLYGAYSKDKFYKAVELKELTDYATVRGVRILPEMDAPAHAGLGWQWGEKEGLGKLAVCVEEEPWSSFCGEPPCGQLNPANENTYKVLQGIYEDLIDMTHITDMFHFGGDEVNIPCWLTSPEIFPENITGEDAVKITLIKFHRKAFSAFANANKGQPIKNAIVWSTSEEDSEVLLRTYPPENYVIQEWGASDWGTMYIHLNLHYRIIISHVNAWYLDCGYGTWMTLKQEACRPVTSWQHVYMHRPWDDMSKAQKDSLLGGEVCLWTEKVSPDALDTRIWPRAAAVAERLWSDSEQNLGSYESSEKVLKDVTVRLAVHRERLVKRSVGADAVWPEWCNRNPESCFEPRSEIPAE